MGDELPAEEGSVAQPESDTADTRRKPSKRGFFRRKLTKPKEPELPAPPTLERCVRAAAAAAASVLKQTRAAVMPCMPSDGQSCNTARRDSAGSHSLE